MTKSEAMEWIEWIDRCEMQDMRHASRQMYTVSMSSDVLHGTYIVVYSCTWGVMYVTHIASNCPVNRELTTASRYIFCIRVIIALILHLQIVNNCVYLNSFLHPNCHSRCRQKTLFVPPPYFISYLGPLKKWPRLHHYFDFSTQKGT